jgi:uncharacterized protein (TIGR03435 family)
LIAEEGKSTDADRKDAGAAQPGSKGSVKREYRAVLGAGGRLTASKAADCTNDVPEPLPPGASALPCHEVVLAISPTGAKLREKQTTPGQLVFTLANILGRPVIDRTAFQGSFDVHLEVSMDGLEGIADKLGVRASSAQPSDN